MARNRDDILHRLMANFSLRETMLHPATLFLAASLVTVAVSIHFWNRYQHHLIDTDSYRLTEDKIRVDAPPNWTGVDPREMILTDDAGVPTESSLLDTDLVGRTAQKFHSAGFVREIRRIEKTTEGLLVDLIYRDAVAMVELNNRTIPKWKRTPIVLPVDSEGVILPGKIVADRNLIRISIFEPARENGLVTWSTWPDTRVQEAAEIGSFLVDKKKSLGIYRIVTFRKPDGGEEPDAPYEIWPDIGTQVIWGNPPGKESEGEVSAEQKIALLEQFVMKYGTLNQLAKRKIDIRSGEIIFVERDLKTAELDAPEFSIER